MNLRHIGIIARKEFKDVLRDRRTLFFMMLLPMVAIRGWDSHLWYVPKVLAVHRNAPGDGVQNRRSEVG